MKKEGKGNGKERGIWTKLCLVFFSYETVAALLLPPSSPRLPPLFLSFSLSLFFSLFLKSLYFSLSLCHLALIPKSCQSPLPSKSLSSFVWKSTRPDLWVIVTMVIP